MTKRNPMIHVRLPQELKERLEICAQRSGRSMNAEVVFLLNRCLSLSEERTGKLWNSEFLNCDNSLSNAEMAECVKEMVECMKMLLDYFSKKAKRIEGVKGLEAEVFREEEHEEMPR